MAHQPRKFDESRFPIAEYLAPEPNDASERAKRHAKGKKYDKAQWRIHPDDVSDNTVRVDSVDWNLPALPFDKSSVVIIGQVLDSRAFLSNDKTGVYSAFTIQVNEILQNLTSRPLTIASVIEVEREGGRVRFPNGRLHLYRISEWDMPKVGLRYVLFLSDNESAFEIITGYELDAGKVCPLDDLPKLRNYNGADEVSFVNELRVKAINK